MVGARAAPVLRERLGRMRSVAGRSRWSQGALAERAGTFRRFVERIAPDWLDETEAMAKAAGVQTEDILLLNALPAGFWGEQGGGCTACVVLPDRCANGATLLHKNRDVRNETQDYFVRRAADGTQYLASRDVGSLGIAHLHSSRGLAGGNNTGSRIPEAEIRHCGLACPHLLRLVAERAGSCDEALAVLEDAVAREVAGGSGSVRGTIFLFAEPGKAMVVEMTSRRLAHAELREGLLLRTNHFLLPDMVPFRSEAPDANSRCRLDRGQQLLGQRQIGPQDLATMARDHTAGPDSICSADAEHPWTTVTACTHVVLPGPHNPRAHTRAAVGNPLTTLFLPVARAIDGLPAECLSGEFHNLARAVYAQAGLTDPLATVREDEERRMDEAFARFAARLEDASPETARAELTVFAARCVSRVRSILEGVLA